MAYVDEIFSITKPINIRTWGVQKYLYTEPSFPRELRIETQRLLPNQAIDSPDIFLHRTLCAIF